MDKIELLPCPFCKSDNTWHGMPMSIEGGQYVDRWAVGCRKCDYTITEFHVETESWPHDCMSRVIARWNTRPENALNDSAKLASAIEVLRLLATPEFWDCLEPECGGVGSCQNDSHSKVVWITHTEGNGYDDARKWLEENVEATQDDSNGR